jgi:hypothetical protein
LGALFGALAWASTTIAESSVGRRDGGVAGQEQGAVSAGSRLALRFTALDLVLLFGSAAALFVLGLAVWRLAGK